VYPEKRLLPNQKEGVYSQVEFGEAVQTYTNTSFESLLVSDDTLIKILVMLDRKLGKRRLRDLKSSMVDMPEIVRYFYQLRCSAEGIALGLVDLNSANIQ